MIPGNIAGTKDQTNAAEARSATNHERFRRTKPKLPSLCVDICVLTCENVEEGKVFLHRKFATMPGYHDGSLRWSGRSQKKRPWN